MSKSSAVRSPPIEAPLNLLKVAQAWIHARGARFQALDADLFGEPAWDILLDLYEAHCLNHQRATSAVGTVAHVPQTTALRWIVALENRGL